MRILVASDLSPASDEAVRQGLSLASAEGNELALCHVLPGAPMHTLFPQDYEPDVEAHLALQPRVAEALRTQVSRLAAGAYVAFQTFIEQGSDYAEIIRRAEDFQAGLLVVGSHGRTGLKRLFLGSVAERVVRYAPCTVLVAREHREGAVLVATDLSDPSLPAIEAGAREAARRGRKLVVMHATETAVPGSDAAMALLGAIAVVEPPEVAETRRTLARQVIQTALEGIGAQGEVQIVDGSPLAEILRLIEALPAELLVVGAKGRSSVSRVVLGSVSANVVQGAPCSVLAVRMPHA
jgi:nucleotide-binding universal stress UspA family protein